MLSTINFVGELSLHLYIKSIEENPFLLEESDVENFPFYKSNLSSQQYFTKCIQPEFKNYEHFVRSALFYLLENVLIKNKKLNLIQFICTNSFIFSLNTSLSKMVIEDIVKSGFTLNFPLEFIEGINSCFDEDKIIRICKYRSFANFEEASVFSPYLAIFHFYFSKQFSFECIKDCEKNNNIVPLVVALRVYEIKLASEHNLNLKNKLCANFEKFKKFLITNKLIEKEFLSSLLQKNKYTSTDFPIKFHVIGLFFCATFATILSSQYFFDFNIKKSQPISGLFSLTTVQKKARVNARQRLLQIPKLRLAIESTLERRTFFSNSIKPNGKVDAQIEAAASIYVN